ncbi:MAG TPA: hypothetical protein VKT73_08885 [Xanthobacteraceae bacterium]|nr:hypothetical protein [Xanthobacteraceae bacterium]
MAIRKLIATAFVVAVASHAGEAKADNMPLIYPDGAVVYGDWGLYRPGAIVPYVEGPYVVISPRYGTGYYFPTNRYDPAAYRSPPYVPPVPSEPWYRSWGVQSDHAPATSPTPYEGPSVIYAPNFDEHEHSHGKKP